MRLEGIVAKRRDSRYRSGRCREWINVRIPPSSARPRFSKQSERPGARMPRQRAPCTPGGSGCARLGRLLIICAIKTVVYVVRRADGLAKLLFCNLLQRRRG
jgi:hypothetical protein